jgi:acyl-CoA thioesterase I
MGEVRTIKVVFFGDSITEGQYIDPTNRWTDLVAKGLKSKYEKNNLKMVTYNKGISGETSRQAILRFPMDVQELSPDILTIQFGLNDCNHWNTDMGLPRVSRDAFIANLEEMIDRARMFKVKHIIFSNNHKTMKSGVLSGNKIFEEQRKIYNLALRDVATRKKVHFCDIESWFEGINHSSYSEYLLPAPDLLHLSLKGHQHYAEKMTEIMQACIEDVIEQKIANLVEA